MTMISTHIDFVQLEHIRSNVYSELYSFTGNNYTTYSIKYTLHESQLEWLSRNKTLTTGINCVCSHCSYELSHKLKFLDENF